MKKVYIKDKQDNKVLPYTHVDAVLDDDGNSLSSHMGAFEDEVRGLVDTPHQEYVTVDTYASLPASGSKDTIYRVSNYNGSTSQVDASVYSEYAWDGSDYTFLCVKSQIGEVFDITVYNNNTKYADLTAALGVNGVNIPESLRKGGMSVKYVHTSDNKYVTCTLIADAFTIDTTKWQQNNKILIADIGKNLLNPNNFVLHKRMYAASQGEQQKVTDGATHCYIKYEIEPSKDYAFRGIYQYTITDNNDIALYDTVVAHTGVISNLPNNAKYLWIQASMDSSTEFYYLTNTQLEIGSEVTSYEPFTSKATISLDGEKQFDLPLLNDNAIKKGATWSSEKINKAIINAAFLDIKSGKNIYNPSLSVSGRLYNNDIGTKQQYTDSNATVWQKIEVRPGDVYSINTVDGYSVTDKDDIVILPLTMTENAFTPYDAAITIPSNGYYLWVQLNAERHIKYTQIEKGSYSTIHESYREKGSILYNQQKVFDTKDLPLLDNMDLTSVVNPNMTKSEFITAINTAFETIYSELNKCQVSSFYYIDIPKSMQELEDISLDFICETINKNFREDVVEPSMSIYKICDRINKAFQKKIYRFCDAKPYSGQIADYSLRTPLTHVSEPSAIISDDGNTLYIYAVLKRIATTDGVNWSEPQSITLSDGRYVMHIGVNYIDGLYYLIGTPDTQEDNNLHLYTSTDGISFTYRGKLFASGYSFAEGSTVESWGNPYLIKEGENFYLYIETLDYISETESNSGWRIHLATCTDIFYSNQDGTIGNWINDSNNPVISRPDDSYWKGGDAAGNPDFAKGVNNRPIRHEGKYYIYFHGGGHFGGGSTRLYRAYSYDLRNWTIEGMLIDFRNTPTAGLDADANSDHCIIEFKNRTYLFYSFDVNINPPTPDSGIRYLVDDRPLSEILKLRP